MGARARTRLIATGSVAGHLLVLLALVSGRADPPQAPFDPEPIPVALVQLPPPAPVRAPPTPTPPAPEPPAPAKPAPRQDIARKTPLPPPPDVTPRPAGKAFTKADDPDAKPTAVAGLELSDGQFAGASSTGSGPPGGECDVARRLQHALRHNPRVQAAVARSQVTGRARMVWNGDWLRDPGQEGEGLAVIREAIMMEVLSTPAACRAERQRGLVLISLNDTAPRVAIGAGEWRWGELLIPRTGVHGHVIQR